jgi:hypothetical protein
MAAPDRDHDDLDPESEDDEIGDHPRSDDQACAVNAPSLPWPTPSGPTTTCFIDLAERRS